MTDEDIVALFFRRSEQAIEELSRKYQPMVKRISANILGNSQDAEETENDTYLACWDSIPPRSPDPLGAYVARIARNKAVARYHSNTALKRNSCYDAVLDELEDCLPAASTPEDDIMEKELTQAVNAFLGTIGKEDRLFFVRRYWFSDSVTDIAETAGRKASHVSSRLFRTRQKLFAYLKEEGYVQ